MSVQVLKTGVINASGEIGANLLGNSNIINRLDTDGSKTVTYTCPDISLLKAKTVLTISVDIEVHNVKTMRRIGVEPSFTSSGTNMYVGVWTSDLTNRKQRISATHTLSRDAINLSQNGIYIQNVTFDTGGYIILSNPKLEIGGHPTPWCPNATDDYYVGNTCGYNELGSTIASIGKGYINATDFIEI
jgi:hypothetical protein